MTHEIQNNGHYSEQSGHWARSQANRTKQTIQRLSPDGAFIRPDSYQGQINRRKMRRVTRDGRQ